MNLLKLKCIINKKCEKKYYTVVYKRLSLLCVMKDVINLFLCKKHIYIVVVSVWLHCRVTIS